MKPRPQARLFLALWPDTAVRTGLVALQSRWAWPAGAAVTPAERLHVTLHFIGAVARERLPELEAGLAVPCPPFELSFGAPALWPHGLAVLLPAAPPPALPALHERLAGALQALALPVEARAFKPHVTFARRAGGATRPPAAPALRWPVAGYALVESERGYRVLKHYPA
jgi:RNA 2',3'-cyclic 3'-phosphodiesterase